MKYGLLLLLMFSGITSAKVISTPSKPIVAVDGSELAKRVCYYQDQAYSLGAVLQVGEHYLICTEANKYETNGALKWEPLKSSLTKSGK